MLKKFYILAWFWTAIAVLISVLTGTFGAKTVVVFGFIVLGLIHALMLWSVIVNTRDTPPE